MTIESNAVTESPTRRRSAGRAQLIAAGVLGAALVVLLGVGGANAVGAMATPRPAEAEEAPPISSAGAQTPVEDPSTPPDRDSDQPEVTTPKDRVYVIARGDTLTRISSQLEMSVDSIAEYNAIRDANVINEGAVLRVPYTYSPPPAP